MIQIYLAVEVKKQENHKPGFQQGGFQAQQGGFQQVPLHPYPNPNPPIVLNIHQQPQPQYMMYKNWKKSLVWYYFDLIIFQKMKNKSATFEAVST